MNLNIVKHTKLWIAIPIIIILIGFGLIFARGGLNLGGVDFVGGSVIYVGIGSDYNVNDLRAILEGENLDADIVSAGRTTRMQ